MTPINTVAVIGSGMAGLSAARALTAAGLTVTVFDKGRNPGGRLATRRVDNWIFNHGCQVFTIRDPDFQAAVRPVSALWNQRGELRYAGIPTMSAVASHLANGLDVRQHAHVESLSPNKTGWTLHFKAGGDATFDALIIAIPAPQASSLLAGRHPDFESRLQGIHLSPCWAVMLGFEAPPPTSDLETQFNVPAWPDGIWSAIWSNGGSEISWAARENARPHAPETPPAFTFHFSPAWSTEHLEDPPEDVMATVLAGNWPFSPHTPAHAAAHRWRYALVQNPLGEPCLWDQKTNLGLCGDWCIAPRLEAAFLSGRALAQIILA
jgi:predicted NAD/FAD-dependent oxidoreductase